MIKVLLRFLGLLVVLLCFGWSSSSASSISGDLYSLGDTNSDGKFNYRLDFSVTNSSASLSVEEVIIHFKNVNFSDIAFVSTPSDWVDRDVADPTDDGFGGLDVAGAADTWTGDSAGYNPIGPGETLGGFSLSYQFTQLNVWDSAYFEGLLWFDDWVNDPFDATSEWVQLGLVFHPYDTGNVDPIPEPGTFLLFGSGIAGLAVVLRKRNRNL